MEALGNAHTLERSIPSDMSMWVQVTDDKRQNLEDAGSEGGGEEEEDMDDECTEFSFEFLSSVTIDLPKEDKMLSAAELFVNGKLRPLQARGSLPDHNFETENEGGLHQAKTDALRRDADGKGNEGFALASSAPVGKESEKGADLPMNLAMVKTSLHESLALAKEQLRSLHENPRCLSMTIEGSRGHRHRSCVSLNSSRCCSPSRSRPLGTFSQPSTTPSSPKAPLSRKNRKFLQFFKLKKHLTSSKEAMVPASERFSASGSRFSRAFWPFSRSNSAGERKGTYAFSPLPRRSNSASESKTTSSSLLPNNPMRQRDSETMGRNTAASLALSARKLQAMQQADRNGLPPLPDANLRRTSPHFAPASCSSDSIALSQPVIEASSCTPAATASRPSTSTAPPPSLPQASEDQVSHPSRPQSSTVQSHDSAHIHTQSLSSISSEFRTGSIMGKHGRHASVTNAPMRGGVTRGSPARQWSNPNMGSSNSMIGGVARFGPPAPALRGNMRPKDALSRESVSVRVTPVLNVPVCMTPSAKSKLFNLGNLFSKREKAGQGYTMLVSTDSQSGG